MRFFAFLSVLLLVSRVVYAHPHQYIDLKVSLSLDGQKRVTAMKQVWVFDAFYTELSLPDFDANGNKSFDGEELAELARQNLLNLRDFDYFTVIEKDGQAVKLPDAKMTGAHIENGRIVMDFELPFETPIVPPFVYSIYDPSYYVEMKHLADGGISVGSCQYTLTKPNPDAVYVTLAASLDKSDVAPDNLGKHFAEKVDVTCP